VGWCTPNFVKFSGEDNRTMWEHVNQYLAQLGDVSSIDALKIHQYLAQLGDVGSIDASKIHLFSLSLTVKSFSWFSFLSHNSIDSWE
jgi:hypothetical protein